MKSLLRHLLNYLHLDISRNLRYDRLSKVVMKRVLATSSNTLDVGCHKGEVLNFIMKCAPEGRHMAFEPLPDYYEKLKKKYDGRAEILPYALSDNSGSTKFQYVRNAPAFSGIKRRKYLVSNPEVEQIEVEMRTIDELIDSEFRIDFLKIDVEGGELAVLKGAKNTLQRCRPVILFEFGLGASEYYGSTAPEMFDFLSRQLGLKVNSLTGFARRDKPQSEEEFVDCFTRQVDYYFVAYP